MGKLRAGAAQVDITPHLGCHLAGHLTDRLATDILDPLHARAVVLESAGQRLAIVSCDLIVLVREDLDPVKARLEEICGIPAGNILIAATHTHYGPATRGLFDVPREDEYVEWMCRRLEDCVRLAANRLQPARVGHESGACPEETHNRRFHMKDGTVRMNPGYQNPDIVRVAGPTDPEVGVLVVEALAGETIAVVANYSLHYVGGPYGHCVSADYFGAFERALQRMAGVECPVLMLNGCCGDVNNIDVSRPRPESADPFHQARRVGEVVASHAYSAWRRIRDWDEAPRLAARTVEFSFHRRDIPASEVEAAQARVASGGDPSDADYRDYLYARELLAVEEMVRQRPTPIQALRIGDLGLAALPGEIFVELGLEIKSASPFPRTMIAELANDWVGYVPTERAFEEGGYETWTARSACCAPTTGPQMVAAVTDMLRALEA